MTTIVTRLYENAAHAADVVANLKAEGFPDDRLDIIAQDSNASTEELIRAAGVADPAARQYAQHMTSKRVLLVVRAPFVPFGAAKTAIEAADAHPSFDAGVADENMNRPDEPDPEIFVSFLPSHPLFLTNGYEVRNSLKPRGLSAAFRIPTLVKRGRQMRPSIIQRGTILPSRGLSHKRVTRDLLIDKFFARFALPHIWSRSNRQMRHFRLTN